MRQPFGRGLTCREVVYRLGDYLDGNLPKTTRRLVRSHCAGCADCRTYFRAYMTAIRAARCVLRHARVERPLSEELVARVLSKRRGDLDTRTT